MAETLGSASSIPAIEPLCGSSLEPCRERRYCGGASNSKSLDTVLRLIPSLRPMSDLDQPSLPKSR